ncbi:MAG TPA: MBL fold metallo-hydrolase [Gammaproteobacteria bacterium]|nr:MBL fold metallo-hydrolase [Gammaproteobacteria bacterium]HIL97309.1 MBL fold metallo-hydrolase [Pseudomonadales bacterium]
MPPPATEIEGNIIFESFAAGPLQCNCTILGDPISRKGIVVDPGGDPERIMSLVQQHDLSIVAIIHTHAHLDHILASGEIRKRTGARLYLHKGDKFLWDSLEQQCAMFGVPYQSTPEPDNWLKDDESLSCCNGVALHTPGHTPGSMSFWFEDHRLLIAGDTLFQMGIGRTDLPGGSYQEIEVSIVERIFGLDGDAVVITGHGPRTSLEFERQANPFFGAGL